MRFSSEYNSHRQVFHKFSKKPVFTVCKCMKCSSQIPMWFYCIITLSIWCRQSLTFRLFLIMFVRSDIKENIKTPYHLCKDNPPLTDGFPSQRASNAESVSMSWRHHVCSGHMVALRSTVELKHRVFVCSDNGDALSLGWTEFITVTSNKGHGVSNQRQYDYLLNCLFSLTTNNTPKPHTTNLLWNRSHAPTLSG